jgi:hypothetical protein
MAELIENAGVCHAKPQRRQEEGEERERNKRKKKAKRLLILSPLFFLFFFLFAPLQLGATPSLVLAPIIKSYFVSKTAAAWPVTD